MRVIITDDRRYRTDNMAVLEISLYLAIANVYVLGVLEIYVDFVTNQRHCVDIVRNILNSFFRQYTFALVKSSSTLSGEM